MGTAITILGPERTANSQEVREVRYSPMKCPVFPYQMSGIIIRYVRYKVRSCCFLFLYYYGHCDRNPRARAYRATACFVPGRRNSPLRIAAGMCYAMSGTDLA
eukprot:2785665-Rhodomonas_salina.2